MHRQALIFIVKRLVTLVAIIFSMAAFSAGYYNTTFGFKVRTPRLAFTTAAQSVMASLCSGVLTVRTLNAFGVATNVGSNLTVDLSGPAEVTFYTNSTCTTTTTSLTITTGTSSASAYFMSTTTGSKAVAAIATGYATGSQSETVTTNAYVWTGGGANATWSTAGNWAGGAAPGAGNIAVFDSTCSSNCSPTITANISTAGLRMNSGYAGTITQNAGVTITMGASGWTQLAGTFAGGNSAITLNGNYNLVGGAFTSTSGTMTANANFLVSGASTFTHQSGTVYFNVNGGTKSVTSGTVTYNNVAFTGNGATYALTGTMTVNGTLTLNDIYWAGSYINTGTILAYGDIVASNYGYSGTGLIKAIGSTNQTITGVSTAHFPNFEVASTGGTVTYSGSLLFGKNYTFTSGALSAGASTVRFHNNAATTTITPGTVAYNNVTFTGLAATFTLVGTMTVNGTLALADTHSNSGSINTGTILAYGDVAASGFGCAGTGLLKIVGSTNQTVTGVSTAHFPNFEVASTGGTVTYSGSLLFGKNYTFTAGAFSAGTSTLLFYNNVGTSTLTPGTVAYNNVTFQGRLAVFWLVGTMTVNGTLTLADIYTNPGSINTGTILAYGNVVASGVGYIGTALLKIVGSTDQTVTGIAAATFPNLEIASTGGTVTYSGSLYFTKNYTYTSGVVSAGTSTLLFYNNVGTSTLTPGTVAYNNVTFQGRGATFTLVGTMTVNGTLGLADILNTGGLINTGTILAYGNVAVSSYGYRGSSTIQMIGADGATLSSVATAQIPLGFSINKTAGTTVTLASAVSLMQNTQTLDVASGSVNMAGYALTIKTNLTLNGNTITKNAGVLTVNSVVAGTGALYGGTVN